MSNQDDNDPGEGLNATEAAERDAAEEMLAEAGGPDMGVAATADQIAERMHAAEAAADLVAAGNRAMPTPLLVATDGTIPIEGTCLACGKPSLVIGAVTSSNKRSNSVMCTNPTCVSPATTARYLRMPHARRRNGPAIRATEVIELPEPDELSGDAPDQDPAEVDYGTVIDGWRAMGEPVRWVRHWATPSEPVAESSFSPAPRPVGPDPADRPLYSCHPDRCGGTPNVPCKLAVESADAQHDGVGPAIGFEVPD